MEEALLVADHDHHDEEEGAGVEASALTKSQMYLYALPQLYVEGAAIIIMTSISKFYSDEMGVDVGFLSIVIFIVGLPQSYSQVRLL